MIPKECKRLAEVDFPIAVVSRHSAREKSIRHGHPSTLHLWWARRPLAACRAMLLGLLLPDPCDPLCPPEFKESARKSLEGIFGVRKGDKELQKALLKFIGDVSDWNVASDLRWIGMAREIVKAAYPDEKLLVVDPFAGGGSIPLEALRLGCDVFASDLNPVAFHILKVMLEDIPRGGSDLADELRNIGAEIQQKAEKELAQYYPKDPDGSIPIAYIWSRTVQCEAPNCGMSIPLTRSFWLCSKTKRKSALRYKVIQSRGEKPRLEFEIFVPRKDKDVPAGTVVHAKATCPCCGVTLGSDRLRAQLSKYNAGADAIFNADGDRIEGAQLLAVVIHKKGKSGTSYRLPHASDYKSIFKAQNTIKHLVTKTLPNGITLLPDEERPISAADRVRPYGATNFRDLTNNRQKIALSWLVEQSWQISDKSLRHLFTLVLGRCVDYWSSGAVWASGGEFVAHTFGLQVIPLGWDYPEAVPWTDSSGSFLGAVDWVARVIDKLALIHNAGQVQLADACESPLPDSGVDVWFTDPPYYDAIRYADLSDVFHVWFKRSLPKDDYPVDPFDSTNVLTPKIREAVEDILKKANGRLKDKTFFEQAMSNAFMEGRRVLKDDGVLCVVFAHKTTEGWEILLSGIIRGGLTITGSWPIATERPGRLRSQNSAALATSVHLICRPRATDAPIGDWQSVLRELPKKVGSWMERLQSEGIRGADLVFACIGPALEIFSRYSKVETADGREVKLAEYLEKVWEVVGRIALENVLGTAEARARNGVAGVLEEDARLTALFLWTLQSTNDDTVEADDSDDSDDEEADSIKKSKTKGYSLIFDVVRRFAQPLGIDLPKWEGRILETKKGVVRLLAVSERARSLFGDDGADTVAEWIEKDPATSLQQVLFPDSETHKVPKLRGPRGRVPLEGSDLEIKTEHIATTLDRVHAAILLQAGGQTNALRSLLKAEVDRGPDFIRLANALSALYPKNSEEKRLLDAMLLAVPR